MKIEFNSIHIESFMSLGDITLDLRDGGYILLQGLNNNQQDSAKSNGSGKSSIWEALVWCLTGNTIRGCKEVENIYLDGGTLIELDFDIDNHNYLLLRAKNHKQYKTNLIFKVDGEDKSGKGIRDTEKILKDYLPELTPSLISSVIVLGQGLPARFTNNTPSGRKEVLEKLSKSDYMIEDLKNRISHRLSTVQSAIRDNEDKYLVKQIQLNSTKQLLEESSNLLKSIEDKDTYQSRINELNNKLVELEESNSIRSKDINTYEEALTFTINVINQIYVEQEKEISEIKSLYEQPLLELQYAIHECEISIKSLREDISNTENIRDVCPTCGQKLPNVFIPDVSGKKQELENLKQSLEVLNSDFDNKLQEKNIKIESIKHNFETSLADNENKQKELKKDIELLKSEYSRISTSINAIEKDILLNQNLLSSIEDKRKQYEDKILKCSSDIENISSDLFLIENKLQELNQKLDVVRKFDTIVKRDFRGYLLSTVINYIDKKSKEYCSIVFENTLIDFKLDGNNISISYSNKEYEMLSGGEKQKVDLIVQFAIRDMLCEYLDFNSSILVLDEIFDNLDEKGCNKVIELISSKLQDINSIYIISHHADELNIPADSYITIIKDKNGVSHIKL